MALVSQEFAILIFIVLVILAIVVTCWYEKYEVYDKGSFHIFCSVFCAIGIVITFLFYYNILQLQAQQQQLAALQELVRINDSLLNSMFDSITESSTIIPNFVSSIMPLTSSIYSQTGSTGDIDPINPQTSSQKAVLSYRIFILWQDIILSNKFITLDPLTYISQFLQRANSQQLYQQWHVNKINFNTDTQLFGDLLFEYALPITNHVAEEYTTVANKLILDPRYQSIFITQ